MQSYWMNLLLTALSAGAGVAVVEWILRSRDRQDRAAFMALRVALILEQFARMCAELNNENYNADHLEGEPFPEWNLKLPKLNDYPEDLEGWRAIPLRMSSPALGLSNKITEGQNAIDEIAAHVPESLEQIVQETARSLGHEAWQTAWEIRRHFNVHDAEPLWDYPSQLAPSKS
jgi:hypothetical protein